MNPALGTYAEGFNGFRRMMAVVPPSARLAIFQNACSEAANYVARGCDRTAAADELVDMASANGLDDADAVQWMIARAFEQIDEIAEEIITEEVNGKANGHDHQAYAPARSNRPERATTYIFPDPETIPKRAWMYGGHYIRGAVTATVAPGGTGKTTLSLYEAIQMASNGYRVWYISGEDPKEEIDRRIAAHVAHYSKREDGCDLLKITGNLFVDDKESYPIKVTKSARGATVVFDEEWLAAFDAAIAADQIDVVIIDPFIAFHTVPENDNTAMDQVIKRLSTICVQRNCCIEISHHVRKPSQAQAEITVDDARGGGAIVNAVRSCRVINRMSSELAEQARVEKDKRTSHLRLDPGKRNMAPPEAAEWWQLVSVKIANGDNVQAIERWEFPKLFGEVSTADAEYFRELIRNGDFRADSRSEKWIGHEVAKRFNRNVEKKGDVIWINQVLGIWEKNGIFKKDKRMDPDIRQLRTFVLPVTNQEDTEI